MIHTWADIYAGWRIAGASSEDAGKRADDWEKDRRQVDDKHEQVLSEYKQSAPQTTGDANGK